VLSLIYPSAVFGPIRLEYDRPVIRVGSSEDNDLVLRHPSVEAHHCLLVFRGEKVLCLPPDPAIAADTNLQNLAGPEYGQGEQLTIGVLQFNLVHSALTVAIPEGLSPDAKPRVAGTAPAARAEERANQGRYFCARCRVFLPNAEVKRVGLVGNAKRYLCPKCSGLLDVEPEPPKPPPGRKDWLHRMARNPFARANTRKANT
jgi:hypothetical protein